MPGAGSEFPKKDWLSAFSSQHSLAWAAFLHSRIEPRSSFSLVNDILI